MSNRRLASPSKRYRRCLGPGRTRIKACVIVMVLVAATTFPAVAGARDALAPVTLDAAAFLSQPARLVSSTDTENVNRIVSEARSFGVPFSVRVQSIPNVNTVEETQSEANLLYANSGIESTKEADDGILLLVQVPTAGNVRSTAAFAHGANTFPRGGITQERLDSTLADVIVPQLAKGQIGAAVVGGASWAAYDQLFISSPRLERSDGQRWLSRVANGPLLLIMLAVGVAYGAIARMMRRRTLSYSVPGSVMLTSPFAAGAIIRGRVDRAVSAAAVVYLADTGSLRIDAGRQNQVALDVGPAPASPDPFVRRIWNDLTSIGDARSGTIAPGSVGRLNDAFGPARDWQRTELETLGYLSPRASAENRWLLIGGLGVILLAIYCMAPAIVSMSRWTLFLAAALIAETILVLWWASRRSFATSTGLRAVDTWKASVTSRVANGEDGVGVESDAFALVSSQDRLLAAPTGIERRYGDETPNLLASMRGFGAS